jgi:hypothetical protein
VGDHPFFYTEQVGVLIDAALDLALIYKCDPYRFLDLPSHELAELYRLTNSRLNKMQE